MGKPYDEKLKARTGEFEERSLFDQFRPDLDSQRCFIKLHPQRWYELIPCGKGWQPAFDADDRTTNYRNNYEMAGIYLESDSGEFHGG